MATTKPGIDYSYLVQEDRVHGSIYTSREIFEEEMERIFKKMWVYVGHTSEIPQPGDYRVTWIGDESVIMTRDEDGQIHLLANRCRHRGSAVCQYEAGNASYFRCPYHGWTYSNDGSLTGVSFPSGYDERFRKEEYGLSKLPRMGIYRGFIFGSLSPTGISLDEHLGDRVKDMIDLFVDLSPEGEIDVRAGVHKNGYHANWKFVGMDGYHGNFVHQSIGIDRAARKGQRVSSPERSPNVTRSLGNGHVMLDGRPARANQPSRRPIDWPEDYVRTLEEKHGKERATELIGARGDPHMGVFPNLQLIDVHIRVTRPLGPAETEVFMYPVLLKGAPPEVNSQRLRHHEWFYGPAGMGSPDDNEVFERNQTGLSAQVDPWVLLSRGRHREQIDADGSPISNYTDELTQRHQIFRWRQEMMTP